MSGLRGRYDVVVNSRRLQYKFTIRRNVTVIRGQSATGKTTLVDMIRDCNENGIDSGVTISCARNCVALSGRNWQRDLSDIENSIVFIDEGHSFVLSQDFAQAMNGWFCSRGLLPRKICRSCWPGPMIMWIAKNISAGNSSLHAFCRTPRRGRFVNMRRAS